MEKTCTIIYYLDKEGQKKSILAGGNGKKEQEIIAPITEAITEVAEVDIEGNLILDARHLTQIPEKFPSAFVQGTTDFVGYKSCKLKDSWYQEHKPWIKLEKEKEVFHSTFILFSEPQTADSILAFIGDHALKVEHRKIEYQAHIKAEKERLATELAEKLNQWEKGVAIHKQWCINAVEREKKEEAAKEVAKKERADWIAQHGSDYLKRATALDYNCQRQYVTERTALEHPGYTIDFDDDARWNSRSCPTMEALEEVEKLVAGGTDAEVVWLTTPNREIEADDEYDPNYWEACEAIVINGFLGKYDLIKIV